MKKIVITSLAFFAIVGGALSFQSCAGVNCVQLVSDIVTATQNYANDDSETNCKALKAAYQAWLDKSKCYNGDANAKSTYEAALSDLNSVCP